MREAIHTVVGAAIVLAVSPIVLLDPRRDENIGLHLAEGMFTVLQKVIRYP